MTWARKCGFAELCRNHDFTLKRNNYVEIHCAAVSTGVSWWSKHAHAREFLLKINSLEPVAGTKYSEEKVLIFSCVTFHLKLREMFILSGILIENIYF